MNDCQHDRFSEYAGAYVLGALSPQERHEFETHLRECPDCADCVQDFAGLPGLLATVPRAVAEAQPVGPLPDTLLPALIRQVRGRERRRRWFTAAAAAAVAAALSVGGLTLAGVPGEQGTTTAGSSTSSTSPGTPAPSLPGTAMAVVGHTPLRADLALEQVPWGTRLDLHCTYPAGVFEPGEPSPYPPSGGGGEEPAYELVVRSTEGDVQQVATWQAVPGKTITVTGATAWPRADIASVQVRTGSGRPLLQLRS